MENGSFQLTGVDCRVLITGGGSGFGLGGAELFAASGGHVVIIDSDSGKLPRACSALGTSVTGMQVDVTNVGMIDDVVKAATATLGGLDVVNNSAGICHYATVQGTSDALWNSVVGVT